MAPGQVFSVDAAAISRWSRFNVGVVGERRFVEALGAMLRQFESHRV